MDYTKLLDFTGKVVLVSGASRGIGEAIVRAFAANGAEVIVSSRKQDSCEAVAASIREAGGKAHAMAAHAGEMDQIKALFEQIEQQFGRLDVLVNCGGTNPFFGPVADTPEAAFDKTVDVNFKGPFYLSAAAVKLMKGKGGSIVNVASINGITPGMLQGVYSMTKAALINMTKSFAKEYGPEGIRVNAICPGLVETKMTQVFTSNEELLSKEVGRYPLRRGGVPDDMVAGTLFFASDASSYTTGQTLVMDGGNIA